MNFFGDINCVKYSEICQQIKLLAKVFQGKKKRSTRSEPTATWGEPKLPLGQLTSKTSAQLRDIQQTSAIKTAEGFSDKWQKKQTAFNRNYNSYLKASLIKHSAPIIPVILLWKAVSCFFLRRLDILEGETTFNTISDFHQTAPQGRVLVPLKQWTLMYIV